MLPTCQLTSTQGTRITFSDAGTIGLLHDGQVLGAPVAAAEVDVWVAGSKTRYTLPYSRQRPVSATQVEASCSLIINGEPWLTLSDRWEATADGIALVRTVEVLVQKGPDTGFAHRFVTPVEALGKRPEAQLFMPAVAYGRHQNVPATALASDPTESVTLVRADRLPYPLVSLYHPATNRYAALIHDPDGCGSTPDEDHPELQIDARFQTPCVGLESQPTGRLVFAMPGTEGSRTYVHGPSAEKNRFVYRAQPLVAGGKSTHRLRVSSGVTATFADACLQVQRTAVESQLTVAPVPSLATVEQQQLDVLSRYLAPVKGVPTLPFSVRLPDGTAIDTSCQFGFIGQATQAAALVLRRPTKVPATAGMHAAALIEFFVANSLSPQGIPRTWFDITGPGMVTWRSYPSYLRVLADGLVGILQADSASRKSGVTHAGWRPFVQKVTETLLGYQKPDGGFPRAWNHDGTVFNASTTNTSHVIPLLVDLYLVTKEPRYREAALRAGRHLIETQVTPYNFVGGTPDNPDVVDKEAGVKALAALLALFDLTGNSLYLPDARRAAAFVCSWTYYHDVRIPEGSHDQVFPKNRGTRGSGIIATGHSGADTFSSVVWFDLLRLSVLMGDAYWQKQAVFHAYATKQLLDHDGRIGYALPGLQNEAFSVAPLRGRGVRLWLPFLTTTHLEPLLRAQDAYGIAGPEVSIPNAELRVRDKAYGRHRGHML